MKYRVIISGGGTGGHIFPAIAIAKALVAYHGQENIEILFVGALGRMEMERVPKAGFKIIGLEVVGIQRRLTVKNIAFPFKLFGSLFKAKKIIKDFNPHLVIGVGGYASGPTLFIASMMHIPTMIQEQNSFAGLTNRWLGKCVDRICVAYENMERFFTQEKIILTGNPVRQNLLKIDQLQHTAKAYFGLNENQLCVLAFGGSLGAKTINEAIEANLSQFSKSNIGLIWQTGKGYFDSINQRVSSSLKDNQKVLPFLEDMDKAYEAADIIVCRSGASSISELCLIGKPVIFIPSPHVTDDHQTFNAKALVKENAAMIVKDSVAVDQLWSTIDLLLKDGDKRALLSENIKAMAKPNATEEIINVANELMFKTMEAA